MRRAVLGNNTQFTGAFGRRPDNLVKAGAGAIRNLASSARARRPTPKPPPSSFCNSPPGRGVKPHRGARPGPGAQKLLVYLDRVSCIKGRAGPAMTVAYLAEFGVAILFGATAIGALAWAIRAGQFSDFSRGAASIFDEEEPVGRPTDAVLKPAAPPHTEGGPACPR